MQRFFLWALCGLMMLGVTAQAEVVRPAPDLRWIDASGKTKSLKELRGQPVVLILTPSYRTWAFKRQLGRLRSAYERLAATKAVFIVAFTNEAGRVPSNIPFAIAADGPKAAFDYGVTDRFAIAIIGRDGNLDYLTNKILPGQRVLDIIDNSFVNQERLRRP